MNSPLPNNRLTRHLLFWAGIVLFFGLIDIAEDIAHSGFCFCHWVPLLSGLFLARLPTFLAYAYPLAYWVFPLVFRGQFIRFFGGLLLLNLVAWFLHDLLIYSFQYTITHWLHQKLPFQHNSWLFDSAFPGQSFHAANLAAGLFICLKLFWQWQQKNTESYQLEQEKLRRELTLLKLQINPDFLFGSLLTLRQLACQQSRQAPEVVLHLAHFLRYVLYESQADQVLLSREVTIIEYYVSLQQTMHPTGLDVSLSVRGQEKGHTLAPLLLFTVVEQAFRQLPDQLAAIKSGELSWVSIDIAIGETQLILKVVHGQPAIAHPDDVVWVGDARKRLHFHYGNTFALTLHSEPDAYIVALTLPLAVAQLQETERQPLFKNSL